MRTGFLGIAGAYAGLPGRLLAQSSEPDAERTIFRIAFGSCLYNSSNPNPLLNVAQFSPDAFVWLGDNIYADTSDPAVFRAKYAQLAANPGFQLLWNTCPNLACWDDHDFGLNDGGADFQGKEIAKAAFLDFWQIPEQDPRRSRGGLYHARMFGEDDKTVNVIQLDNRYFRAPHNVTGNPLLGEEQWAWLEEELLKPATVKIVTSGITIFPDVGYEGWHQHYWERTRLLKLLKERDIDRVLFVSGDRHWSDLSAVINGTHYPIYELCASSLDQSLPFHVQNAIRLGSASSEPNFGIIDIDWGSSSHTPRVTLENYSAIDRHLIRSHTFPLEHISRKKEFDPPKDALEKPNIAEPPPTGVVSPPTGEAPSDTSSQGENPSPPTTSVVAGRKVPMMKVSRGFREYTVTGRRINKSRPR